MCSPMPDIGPEDINAPPACFRYPHCEAREACGWPQCSEDGDVIDMGAWSLPPGPWNVGDADTR